MIDTMALWHDIAKSRQPERLNDILADDAVMVSPVVFTPQKGKAITQKYLAQQCTCFSILSSNTCANLVVITQPCLSLKQKSMASISMA